ncbi:hypothetical protein [Desulforegula conservatrix]|uniref:hypothetical protein n=1 Tax=Desulforegula conservatrix TaxID=153026 RepID=UPI000403BF62|nr:hypothetical protein [Desulforegula conservatrix]
MSNMRVSIFIILFLINLPAYAAEQGPIGNPWKLDQSPSRDISIGFYRAKKNELNQIWLTSEKANLKKHFLLYEFERDADVIFSNDEKWLAINDRLGSNVSEVRLFNKKSDLEYVEVKQANVTGKTWAFFFKNNNLKIDSELSHSYIECIRWSGDSNSILVVLKGHTDKDHYLDDWVCVYNTKNLSPTLDFKIFNQNSVHFKKP